jgi:hypothetical protein
MGAMCGTEDVGWLGEGANQAMNNGSFPSIVWLLIVRQSPTTSEGRSHAFLVPSLVRKSRVCMGLRRGPCQCWRSRLIISALSKLYYE